MSDGDRLDPGNPMNKHETRERVRHVRDALLQWDAIGVAGHFEADDEYDCMISPLMHQLHDGASPRQIAKWIGKERVDHFGLSRDRKADKKLAKTLTHWWRSL